MGSLCSRSSSWAQEDSGHQVLSSGSSPTERPSDARQAAADAAEQRLKAAQARGTHSSNPKQGRLAAKANKPARHTPEEREPERVVWD